jgi:RimK family alpha-L-glutamate ligase
MLAIVGGETKGNVGLVEGLAALGREPALVPGLGVRSRLRPGDVAIGRLDVLRSLDGIEDGLLELFLLERAGRVRVVNGAGALLAAHDKLRSLRLIEAAGLPSPRTRHVRALSELRAVETPIVVKPRFGSWGSDVFRCLDRAELERCCDTIGRRTWFRRHGALAQEVLAPGGSDLRLIVAGGQVAGAMEREAAPGEWRTNVSLGGTRAPANPPLDVCRLGIDAARAIGADLVGVDLFPLPGGGFVVLELNGAVDFDGMYSLPARNVYEDVASSLRL